MSAPGRRRQRTVAADRSRPLHEGAPGGHNRWHPDLEPVARCEPGTDEIMLDVIGRSYGL